jgi:sulfur carrier protein
MRLLVNGNYLEVDENITIKELLNNLKVENKAMAVAVNMEVVKKQNWDKFILKDNDKIEILQFVGGG